MNRRTSQHTEQTKLQTQQQQSNQPFYRTSQEDSLSMNYYAFAPLNQQQQVSNNDSALTKPINAVIQKQPVYAQQPQQQQQLLIQQQQLSAPSSALVDSQQISYNRVIDNTHSLNTKIPAQGQVLLSQPQGVQSAGLEQSTRAPPAQQPQKAHATNRRIFDDSSERAMRGSSASFNRGQQQQSRIFKQSPISQRKSNLKERLAEEGDERQIETEVSQQINRNQTSNNGQQQQQQQFVQVIPSFPVTSQSAAAANGPGIRLLKNSDIIAPRQYSDQPQQYSANNLPSSSSSGLASFGVIKPKEQSTNTQQVINSSDKTTTPTPQNLEQQPQQQLHQTSSIPSVMQLSNLTTHQSQLSQHPMRMSTLQNPNTQPLLQGLSSYNRVTDQQTYPQQQQQVASKNDNNNKVEIPTQHPGSAISSPYGNKDTKNIYSEKDYQKLLHDNNTLTEQLLDAQVQTQQLTETIAQMKAQNQADKQQTEDTKVKETQQQSQEVSSLRNQLAEKDRQFNEVIQELRDAQKQLGLFADQVLTLKSQLGQVQQQQQKHQGEEIRQNKEQQQQQQLHQPQQQLQAKQYVQNVAIQQPQQQQQQSISITNRLPQHLQQKLPNNYQVVLTQKDQNLPTTYITPNINPKSNKAIIPQLAQQQQSQQQPASWLFPSTNASKQLDPRKHILQAPSSSSSRAGTPDRFGSNPPDLPRMMAMNQNRMLFTTQPIKFNP